MPRHTVGEAVKRARGEALRVARGAMKRETLAGELGISHQQLSKYERGENLVSAALADRAAAILSCRITDIYVGAAPETAGGVSEEAAPFDHESDALDGVLQLAQANLTGPPRHALRRFIVELLDEPA
ncbi:hypothetical protein BH09PSE2_BH09PSE2_25190 [soil metagenome]